MMNASQGSPTGRRRAVVAVLAATAVLGGAGAVTAVAVADDGGRHGTSPGTSGTRHPESADDTRTTGTATDLVRAATAGVAELPGTVTAVELDEHRGRTVWKVEIVATGGARHEVTVNAADGTVTGSRPDGTDDGDAALARSARTGLAAAVRSALARVPGSATSVEVDDLGGSAAWEVEIAGTDGTAHEVTVTADSGKVASVGPYVRSTAGTDDRGRHGTDDNASGRTTDDIGTRHSTPRTAPTGTRPRTPRPATTRTTTGQGAARTTTRRVSTARTRGRTTGRGTGVGVDLTTGRGTVGGMDRTTRSPNCGRHQGRSQGPRYA